MDRIANGTQLAAAPTPDVPTGTPGYFGRTTDGAPGPTRVGRDWFNQITEEIRNVIVAAGITPAYNVFTQLLAAIRTLSSQAIPYCVDTGVANAYVITPAPPLSAYAGGITYRVKFTHANTGPSSIAVSGLAPRGLTREDGSALEPGDIPLASEGLITDNGTEFLLAQQPGVFVGDSGSGGFKGLVPAPTAGDAAANKFLSAAGIWAAIVAFVGDSGSGGTKGLVPAPAAGDGALKRKLSADGTWAGGEFVSAAQILAASGRVSVAHGLGASPGMWGAYVQCTTAENGYAVGDRIILPFDYYDGHAGGSNTAMTTVQANATTVSYSALIAGGAYVIVNAAGTSDVTLNMANWSLYLWARL